MGEAELVEIVIEGPGPFGFRLYGGEGDPLIVAKVSRISSISYNYRVIIQPIYRSY